MHVLVPASPDIVTTTPVETQVFQHGVNGEAGQGQHGDFAQGIEAPEIDQDDVDHVMPAAAGDAVFQEVIGDAGVGPGQHCPGQRADARAGQ